MRRLLGQAARRAGTFVRAGLRSGLRSGQARHTGTVLHWLATVAVAVAVLGCMSVGILAWRLSQGPLDLPWLTTRVEAALNQDRTSGRITIGSAALAWEGFRLGVDRPLDIRLTTFTFTDATGREIITVPRAEISLSLHALLFGRFTPRALEIDQAHVSLVRAADGSILAEPGLAEPGVPEPDVSPPGPDTGADVGPVLALLTELAKPTANDGSKTQTGSFSQLRRLRIQDASLVVADRTLGTTWRVSHADLDLTRRPQGGVDGTANVTLALGDQQTRLTATATLPPNKGPIRLRLRTTPVTPASIARLVPRAAFLNALDVPIGGEADVQLDDATQLVGLHLALRAGTGKIHIADGVLPITGATAVADATPDHLDLRNLRLSVPSHPGGTDSIVLATGSLDRAADHLTAALGIDLDRVNFADLPRVWPMGVGHHARTWITENIPVGAAHDGHFAIGLEATRDLSDVTLTRATGTLAGDGLEVHWLRPVPPISNATAVLNILDPDTMEILARSGHQQPDAPLRGQGNAQANLQNAALQGLSLRGGRMRITGIMHHDQFTTIEAQVSGSVPDALALLQEPRLQLLDRHPLPLNDPAGQMAGTVTLTFPLEEHLQMEQVAIRARAHLDSVHLGGVVAGRDLDQGVLDLDANVDGLTANGKAAIAGIPASLTIGMDFHTGGPSQVLQRVTMNGRPTTRQLAAAGLDVSAVVDGTIGLDATLTERRDGAGAIVVSADFTPASVSVPQLAWRKPVGSAMSASGRVMLSHDRLTGIESLLLKAADASATGSVTCVDGKPAAIWIDHLTLGRTQAQATIRLPSPGSGPAGAIAVSLSGPTLDLAPRLTRPPTPRPPRSKTEVPSGPHWTLDARFDQVILARDHQARALVARVESDGGLTRRLEVDGLNGPAAPFSVRLAPEGGKRTLKATAANAGELLAGLDLVQRMQGGQLAVTGSYDDTTSEHPLEGTAEISDFRIRDAPILARLLQAMTLYGLVEVVRGPGLGFTQMVAPFRLTDDALTLTEMRAFSPSLGLTAKGTLDLDTSRVAIEGTIVPAYFFNSLLGNIPLVGRLFSPEQGGGVFAASYAVHGPLEDPTVSVNPLSALTPGFLRGLFGLF